VVIAGGGVAGLEALLALRDLAGDRVSITLLAPELTFTDHAMAVTQVFARGRVRHYELARIANSFAAEFVHDRVDVVDPDAGHIHCTSGTTIDFDHLILAVGANARRAWCHGITFGQDPSEAALHELLVEVERGFVAQVAFVVPGGTVWPVPLYELAIMTARHAWSMGMDRVRFALVTPEERPLGVFGRAPSEAVAELLDGCGIEFIGSTYADVGRCSLQLDPGGRELTRARVVSLPVLDGPDLPGVPADTSGFILADAYGRVSGLDSVYAAGDGAAFPIKQGGLATQQADAAAESIAAAVGAPVTPRPFRPLLRATLLTGGDTHYLRHSVAGGDGEGEVATHELWSPAGKITSRYLTPYLLEHDCAGRLKATSSQSRSRSLPVPELTRSG
jgi:sulfide:quinone oxidoreductase